MIDRITCTLAGLFYGGVEAVAIERADIGDWFECDEQTFVECITVMQRAKIIDVIAADEESLTLYLEDPLRMPRHAHA